MTESTENMVLRTVYLPVDIDRRLKDLGFALGITKNELIRTIIRDGIGAYAGQTFEERLASAAAPAPAPAPAPRRPREAAPKAARQAAFEPAE
ncbi:hypothetical protein [Brevundimonas variabilis]|uniref:Ribbon-helix-helix protein CopG domain-containing protein n=1 Tax=Brevundimonas variabilis TaxID=74312 RepID=A0A7W9FEK7_9CAUL|nr:hypothetical protein [Brevundimonas variabilis]MBB5746561.1 hypothetical protein [Brevundimonas variabilis]